jgi:hypothetical protein
MQFDGLNKLPPKEKKDDRRGGGRGGAGRGGAGASRTSRSGRG